MEQTPQEKRNIKMVIAYRGCAYHGWQRQADGFDTVQERLEAAAVRVLGHPVCVHGAGRTDAGVHAAGQVGNLHTTNLAIPIFGFHRAMNSRLPPDIFIRSACLAPPDFHASTSATGKTYQYRIHVSPQRPVELAGLVYHYNWHKLDVDRMRLAAARLVGTHDFRGMATSSDDRRTTVRTIFACQVAETDGDIYVTVRGDGFLYNMVRNIVGTLMEIGRGRWSSEQIDLILSSRDRSNAGPTAPPDGLSLMCVHYDGTPRKFRRDDDSIADE